jgi:hypothetical protein
MFRTLLIDSAVNLTNEVDAWVRHRNSYHAKANWHFTTETARVKLRHLYPVI